MCNIKVSLIKSHKLYINNKQFKKILILQKKRREIQKIEML